MATSSERSKTTVTGDNISLSKELLQLYESAAVKNSYEAFTVIFHSFMLESGFAPQDVAEKVKFQVMPKNWNSKEVYKILYCHCCCPEYKCCMTCIPLYNTICVQGIVCDVDCSESVDIKVEMTKYSKQTQNFSNILEVFQTTDDLSRHFKDGFCLPVLNLLHETIGCSTLFGLRGLFHEIKIYMMEFLPVEDVLAMSSVNQEFNSLANLSQLWKCLFIRDFAKGGVLDMDTSSEVDWKQKYKVEYLKKKRRPEPRVCLYYPFVLDPDDTDINIGFPPYHDPFDPLPYIFPILPPRMPPFFRRLN